VGACPFAYFYCMLMNGWKETRRVALSRAQSPAVLLFALSTAGDHRRSFSKFNKMYRCGSARFNRSRDF
ncbi:MAG: hypothetical protein KDK30_18405, partial [Leptospiraceae bacterium]|nr:hypothetical protein [Leptospiraceae bacterium]